MDLTDFDFSLRWPKELFLWETRRIGALRKSGSLANMVACLFAEAFVDGDIAVTLEQTASGSIAWGAQPAPIVDEAARLLHALLKNPDTLHPYKAPQYWLERHNGSAAVTHHKTLPVAFAELVGELRGLAYFPKILPKPCVDDSASWDADPSAELSRAIHANVSWPLDDSALSIADDVLFSVVEYFHNQAQRPRTRSFHSYSECGWHYDDHNRESGSVVYRWRVNELLDSYDVGFHLGSKGPKRGVSSGTQAFSWMAWRPSSSPALLILMMRRSLLRSGSTAPGRRTCTTGVRQSRNLRDSPNATGSSSRRKR